MNLLIMAFIFAISTSHAKVPAWAAQNSTKLKGSSLRTVCHGVGPSVDIARSEALKSCQLSASQFFKSKVKIKSLSVETEKSVGFHQEVSSVDEITNLICDPLKDELEEKDSHYSVWVECKFDLTRAKLKPSRISEAISEDDANLAYSKPSKIKTTNSNKTVFLSTIPMCESVIIRGERPRTIECKTNPVELNLFEADTEAIVRAKDYKPKNVRLNNRRNDEAIQILLDK